MVKYLERIQHIHSPYYSGTWFTITFHRRAGSEEGSGGRQRQKMEKKKANPDFFTKAEHFVVRSTSLILLIIAAYQLISAKLGH